MVSSRLESKAIWQPRASASTRQSSTTSPRSWSRRRLSPEPAAAKAQDNFNRIRPLVEKDINPPQDLVTAQTDLDSAKANEQAAQAGVEAIRRAVASAQAGGEAIQRAV